MKEVKIITVCLGNICRSPMAEGILRHKLKELQIKATIDSAGTGGWHAGEHPDPRAIKTMKHHGIDISKLKARQITKNDLHQFDVVLAMDEQNYSDILSLSAEPVHHHKVKLMLSFHPKQSLTSVPDPWYGNMDGFERVYHLLDEACDAFINQYPWHG